MKSKLLRSDISVFLALFILNAIVFWKIFPSFFFADDFYFINLIKGYGISSIMGGLWSISVRHFFTPLPLFVGWAGYKCFSLDPAGYFLFNFIFHFFNSVLLYIVMEKTTGSKLSAAISAILFIVFCGNWETVGWIGAVNHILYAFFIMLTLLAFIEKRYRLSCIMFILAALCHETAIMLVPAIIFLYDLIVGKNAWRATLKNMAPYIVIAGLFLIFKIFREFYFARTIGEGSLKIGFHVIANYLGYISTLMVPITLSYKMSNIFPEYLVKAVNSLKVLSLLVLPACMYLVLKYGERTLKFSLLAILAIFIPYSLFNMPIVSRYMYEASMFYCCIVSILIANMLIRKGSARNIGAALLLAMFVFNLGGMIAYQTLFYNKKEIRRDILNAVMAKAPKIKTGSTLCFVDLPIRTDEISGMISLWHKNGKFKVSTLNANNVSCVQTYKKGDAYGQNYVFLYDCRSNLLKMIKSPN